MLKQLLIVIFVLQGFAFNAMASTNMSQFNQAEITKMQIMHQTVESQTIDNQTSASHTGCLSEQSQVANNCCSNGEGSCHNLVCNSIHATQLFDTKPPHLFQSGTRVSDTVPSFSVSVPVISFQPEIPPPLV